MEQVEDELKSAIAEILREAEKGQSRLRQVTGLIKKLNQLSDFSGLLQTISQNEELITTHTPRLLELTHRLEKSREEARMRSDADLRDAIQNERWAISGQWPSYYVDYLVPITLDDQKFQVTVGDEKPFNFSVPRIITTLKKLLGSLRAGPKEQANFLKELFASCKEGEHSQPASLSIWDAYKRVVVNRQNRKFWRNASRVNFRPLPVLQFSSLLTGLLHANLTQISGYQLRLLPPIAREDSLYIHDPAEGRFVHVGRIQFIKEGE